MSLYWILFETNETALVKVMTWHITVSKTVREPVITPHPAPAWGGGALGQVSYGGVQLRGPNPYPILGKAGLRKHTLF